MAREQAKDRSGRDRNKRKGKGKRQGSAPKNRWKRKAEPLSLGRQDFRVRIYGRRKGRRDKKLVTIDDMVESIEWAREGEERTGTLTFRQPMKHLEIESGELVVLDVDVGGKRRRHVWGMRVVTPQDQIREGITSLELGSGLANLKKIEQAWDISRKNGKLRASDVTRRVARECNVPVGRMPKGKADIDKVKEKDASAWDVIHKAWEQEHEETGRRYDIDLSGRRLEVLELKPQRYLYLLRDQIIEATVTRNARKRMATVVKVTTSTKTKGSRKRKTFTGRAISKDRVRRHGRIEVEIEKKDLRSNRACRKKAEEILARVLEPKRTLTVSTPGIPFVDRRDACRVRLREHGIDDLVFVTSARHNASSSGYDMELELDFEDPFEADREAFREEQKKKDAEKKRGRKSDDDDEAAAAPTSGRGRRQGTAA